MPSNAPPLVGSGYKGLLRDPATKKHEWLMVIRLVIVIVVMGGFIYLSHPYIAAIVFFFGLAWVVYRKDEKMYAFHKKHSSQ